MKYAILDQNGLPQAFYSPDIHGKNIPAGAVEISDDQWCALSTGNWRYDVTIGQVVAFTPPPPTREQWLDSEIRPKRNALLTEADTLHCNSEKWESMTVAQKTAWRAYKQALRDLPKTIAPDNPVWPQVPA